jgi:hypothetical protein
MAAFSRLGAAMLKADQNLANILLIATSYTTVFRRAAAWQRV